MTWDNIKRVLKVISGKYVRGGGPVIEVCELSSAVDGYVQSLSSYLTVNTLRVGYKNQSVNAV